MIRRLKNTVGIRFSVKALARNPSIYCRQLTHQYRSFRALVAELATDRPISIIQVGANDGIAHDPIGELVLNSAGRIRGLLIEPQRRAFERLTQRYAHMSHIKCLRAAIGKESGTACIYSVNQQAAAGRLNRSISDGIGSLDRRHVEAILKSSAPALLPQDLDALVAEELVPITTLAAAQIGAGINHADVLLVDTEGLDGEIVHTALDCGMRPNLVQYEHKHLSGICRRSLSKRLFGMGYRLWADHADVWGQYVGAGASPTHS